MNVDGHLAVDDTYHAILPTSYAPMPISLRKYAEMKRSEKTRWKFIGGIT
jgi:hypothetical protein